MKSRFICSLLGWVFFLLGVIGLGTGCSTTKIDWNQRVGTYTFDNAVREMGPPDKSAQLSSGSLVAEWITHFGYDYPSNYFYDDYWYDPFYYHSSYRNRRFYNRAFYYSHPVRTPDYFLRLSFDPKGILEDWLESSR